MNDDSDRRRLAEFCRSLDDVRRLLRGPATADSRDLVERVVRAARNGDSVGDLLDRLPRATVSGDDRSPLPPPLSDDPAPPLTGVYLCPAHACSRLETRAAGTARPVCDVHDQALRFAADGPT